MSQDDSTPVGTTSRLLQEYRHGDSTSNSYHPLVVSRRQALIVSAATIATLLPTMATNAIDSNEEENYELEDIRLGEGSWTNIQRSMSTNVSPDGQCPSFFAAYMVRFLLFYDPGVSSWWKDLTTKYSLVSETERTQKLQLAFGRLAASIQSGVETFLLLQQQQQQQQQSDETRQDGIRKAYSELARLFLEKYGTEEDAKRQIGILFSLLPANQQPTDVLNQLSLKTIPSNNVNGNNANEYSNPNALSDRSSPKAIRMMMADDITSLLPKDYESVRTGTDSFSVFPFLNVDQVTVEEELGTTVVSTTFGPVATNALTRELPRYPLDIYTLLGISGATGCALTHTFVIPLDVVKTKAQTNPDEFKSLFNGALKVVETEGIQGLTTGAQATIAGFFWYGLSVYPSYTFFKRFLTKGLLPPEIAMVHANDIALVAGAIAAIIASFGLTPLEAARIRVVAEPKKYKPLGLAGTLQYIANEDPNNVGWKSVYAGLPSLMTRQVIFGSVKFLAFERACETIFSVWPFLRDATWTALLVSLIAGGFSGALSSIVSQPADSVLTYVAQRSESVGVLEGCILMVKEEGMQSLFRGLGSRCVWAGSIIAGQFLLYDVFRNYFYVNGQDLSQVFQIVIQSPTG